MGDSSAEGRHVLQGKRVHPAAVASLPERLNAAPVTAALDRSAPPRTFAYLLELLNAVPKSIAIVVSYARGTRYVSRRNSSRLNLGKR